MYLDLENSCRLGWIYNWFLWSSNCSALHQVFTMWKVPCISLWSFDRDLQRYWKVQFDHSHNEVTAAFLNVRDCNFECTKVWVSTSLGELYDICWCSTSEYLAVCSIDAKVSPLHAVHISRSWQWIRLRSLDWNLPISHWFSEGTAIMFKELVGTPWINL